MMTGLLQPQAAKILTVNEFKRDKRRFTGGLNKIVNADDVGMVQPAALFHFTLKIVECGRIACEFLGQSLDGQLLAGLLIHGQPYFAPSAPSQLALQLVAAGQQIVFARLHIAGQLKMQPAIGHLHRLAGPHLHPPQHPGPIKKNSTRARCLYKNVVGSDGKASMLIGGGHNRDGASGSGPNMMSAFAKEEFLEDHAVRAGNEYPDRFGGHEKNGGEGGIRTLGRRNTPYGGLANHCIQPLCHLTGRADGNVDRCQRGVNPSGGQGRRRGAYCIHEIHRRQITPHRRPAKRSVVPQPRLRPRQRREGPHHRHRQRLLRKLGRDQGEQLRPHQTSHSACHF